jgi:hypothetical protein
VAKAVKVARQDETTAVIAEGHSAAAPWRWLFSPDRAPGQWPPSTAPRPAKWLAACDWIAERRSLLITGASGLGPPFDNTVQGWITFFWQQLRFELTNAGLAQANLPVGPL